MSNFNWQARNVETNEIFPVYGNHIMVAFMQTSLLWKIGDPPLQTGLILEDGTVLEGKPLIHHWYELTGEKVGMWDKEDDKKYGLEQE